MTTSSSVANQRRPNFRAGNFTLPSPVGQPFRIQSLMQRGVHLKRAASSSVVYIFLTISAFSLFGMNGNRETRIANSNAAAGKIFSDSEKLLTGQGRVWRVTSFQ